MIATMRAQHANSSVYITFPKKEPCGVNGKRRQGFVEPAQKTCESFMNKSD